MAEEHEHYAGTNYEYGSCWRLSWGAIFCGLFAALAVFIVLQLLGAGIGISTLDIQDRYDNPEASSLGIGAGIWWFISGLISLFVGGWVAGYFANLPEKMASALHGFVVWSLMYLVMFWLVTTALASIVGGTVGLIGKGISTAGQAAASPQGQQTISQSVRGMGIDANSIKQSVTGAAGANTPDQNKISPQVRQKAQQAKEQAKETGQKAIKITGGSLIGLSIAMMIGAVVSILGAITGARKIYAEHSHGHTTHRH